ncbi:hypothetical protein [Terriglobus tenax]|uniref:hypothetical protein n=1 Tax=Terriglobus tenax TaxID=1111115 RepID=UPI0021E0F05D|nr:hypothetical protein [Terriglobus tenax]
MLAFTVLVSAMLLVTLTLPQLHLSSRRGSHMRHFAEQTGGDFPDDEIPQDFPFSLTDDLGWGDGCNCIFWRAPQLYMVALDVSLGFGKAQRPLTLVAIHGTSTRSILWSLPRGLELRRDGDWAVIFRRGEHHGLLSTHEIEQLRQIALHQVELGRG